MNVVQVMRPSLRTRRRRAAVLVTLHMMSTALVILALATLHSVLSSMDLSGGILSLVSSQDMELPERQTTLPEILSMTEMAPGSCWTMSGSECQSQLYYGHWITG